MTKKEEREASKAFKKFFDSIIASGGTITPCTVEDLPKGLILIAGNMPTKSIIDKNGREIKIADERN